MRLRILPILIIAALLAVSHRVSDLFSSADPAPAFAQEASNEGEQELVEETRETAQASTNSTKPAPSEAAGEPEAMVDEEPIPAFQRAGLSIDPFDLTDEELEILQSLAERRAVLEQREREIDQRAAVLSAAEARIEEKIARLEKLRTQIEGLLAENEKRNDAQIESLARIYSAMKPKEAAKVFDNLSSDVLLDVIRSMQERTSAAILAKMNPVRAQEITLQLAQLNRIEQKID